MMGEDARAWMRPHHISQGEYATGNGDGGPITTILGSCVATCLRDPVARVGGMNHFLLPDGVAGGGRSASFGVNAMELLVNSLIRAGAERSRIEAKVFGAARMIAGLSDAGERNAAFVIDFLRREGIMLTGQSLGGTQARRVMFWPEDGLARQKLLGEFELAEKPLVEVSLPRGAAEVELF